MCDIIQAPAAVFTTDANSAERRRLMAAWATFGTGFYTVALDMIFVGVFLLFSIVMAVAKGKKKEEPTRRAPRRKKDTDTPAAEGAATDKATGA